MTTPPRPLPDLDSDQYIKVEHAIAVGTDIEEVIGMVHDWGCYTDTSDTNLRRILTRIKSSVLTTQQLMVAEQPPEARKATVEVLQHPIDVYAEMETLVRIQKDRVGKVLEKEANMPLTFNWLGGEIKILSGLVGDLKVLQQDLGLLHRSPTVLRIEGKGTEEDVQVSERHRGQFRAAASSALAALGIDLNASTIVDGTFEDLAGDEIPEFDDVAPTNVVPIAKTVPVFSADGIEIE
jgi:hypothetical protein